MGNEIILFTQIASLVAFFAALFVPYKALVSAKDGTIEQLKATVSLKESDIKHLEDLLREAQEELKKHKKSNSGAAIKKKNEQIASLLRELNDHAANGTKSKTLLQEDEVNYSKNITNDNYIESSIFTKDGVQKASSEPDTITTNSFDRLLLQARDISFRRKSKRFRQDELFAAAVNICTAPRTDFDTLKDKGWVKLVHSDWYEITESGNLRIGDICHAQNI